MLHKQLPDEDKTHPDSSWKPAQEQRLPEFGSQVLLLSVGFIVMAARTNLSFNVVPLRRAPTDHLRRPVRYFEREFLD